MRAQRHASLGGTRSDTAAAPHTRSLNEGCVRPKAFPTAWDGSHVTVGWVWPGAWPGGRGQGSSSSSPASPAGAVIGRRREWREGKEKGWVSCCFLLFAVGFCFMWDACE